MNIVKLSDRPELYDKLIEQIESSFNYPKEFSYNIDFYPLVKTNNHHHMYLLLDNKNTICAHIGVLPYTFRYKEVSFSSLFLGGIFVNPTFRGQGCLNLLMDYVLKTSTQYSLLFLWSDLHSMYEKWDFKLRFTQYQTLCKGRKPNYITTKFSKISAFELSTIKDLYNKEHHNRFQPIRTDEDWKNLKYMDSMDLLIWHENLRIKTYAVQNKGADLTNIIHEFGGQNIQEKVTNECLGYLWSDRPISEIDSDLQKQALCKIQNNELFKQFLESINSSKEDFFSCKMSPLFIPGSLSI